ncbi:flagellar protein FlgN [Desulfuromonas sp. AOP6]|uniref:flagellar protein FlgN n=1 Tax=Desulfuromonas sp. AOP6 TaxID=1566351 RepID=UPI001271F437|nr:flagellar protein FlgN [Desulfuromonas sp. AOP6]BCA79139.1 hypothetical protein AOP6_0926 [Desulfuromonas sp. AOP6]
MASTLRAQLEELYALILKERECAKTMAMDELLHTVQAKNELLRSLQSVTKVAPEDRELAVAVREENRRNAYLFWASLGFIRESMSFFRKELSPVSYGAHGATVRGRSEGMLLRGRI